MNPTFAARFPQQLGYWALHGTFNALPSFIIAMLFMGLWEHPAAVAGMLSAIGFYIVTFAVVTSLPGPLAEKDHMLSRSIRMGAKIRTGIAGISIPLSFTPFALITPDLWCGLLAIAAQNAICRFLGMESSMVSMDSGEAKTRFFPVFSTTMIEGFIISFLLVMISFFCVIVLQSRERKRLMQLERFRNIRNRALPPDASGCVVQPLVGEQAAGSPEARQPWRWERR